MVRSRAWSYGENLNAIVWATAHMPARVCRDILGGCARYLEAPPSRTEAPIYRPPNDLQMLRFLIKTWSAWVKRQVEGVLLILTHEDLADVKSAGYLFAEGYGCQSFQPNTTGHPNLLEFCDPQFDVTVRSPLAAQAARSPTAATLWEKADRQYTDQASHGEGGGSL